MIFPNLHVDSKEDIIQRVELVKKQGICGVFSDTALHVRFQALNKPTTSNILADLVWKTILLFAHCEISNILTGPMHFLPAMD